MQHKGFYLTCPMKIGMFIFKNKEKTNQDQTGRTVELDILQQAEVSGTLLLTAFLESDPTLHCFLQTQLILRTAFFSMKL